MGACLYEFARQRRPQAFVPVSQGLAVWNVPTPCLLDPSLARLDNGRIDDNRFDDRLLQDQEQRCESPVASGHIDDLQAATRVSC
jgi:hypothetical protein